MDRQLPLPSFDSIVTVAKPSTSHRDTDVDRDPNYLPTPPIESSLFKTLIYHLPPEREPTRFEALVYYVLCSPITWCCAFLCTHTGTVFATQVLNCLDRFCTCAERVDLTGLLTLAEIGLTKFGILMLLVKPTAMLLNASANFVKFVFHHLVPWDAVLNGEQWVVIQDDMFLDEEDEIPGLWDALFGVWGALLDLRGANLEVRDPRSDIGDGFSNVGDPVLGLSLRLFEVGLAILNIYVGLLTDVVKAPERAMGIFWFIGHMVRRTLSEGFTGRVLREGRGVARVVVGIDVL